jgi:hypothetical protein
MNVAVHQKTIYNFPKERVEAKYSNVDAFFKPKPRESEYTQSNVGKDICCEQHHLGEKNDKVDYGKRTKMKSQITHRHSICTVYSFTDIDKLVVQRGDFP